MCAHSVLDTAGRPAPPTEFVDPVVGDSTILSVLSTYTDALVDALRVALGCAGASRFICDQLDRQVRSYLEVESERVWSKAVKYLLAYPKSIFLRCELPPVPPNGPFEAKGPLRRWMKPRLKCFNNQNIWLWDTWGQGVKKALLPLSENLILRSHHDHRNSLTQEDVSTPSQAREIVSNRDARSLLRRVKKDLARFSYMTDTDWDESLRDYPPSEKACYEAGRRDGGALGAIRYQALNPLKVPLVEDQDGKAYYVTQYPSDNDYSFEIVTGHPYVKDGTIRDGLECIQPRIVSASEDDIIEHLHWRVEDLPDYEEGDDRDFINRVRTAYGQVPKCIVASVLEPNKVRNVSKGESRLYHRTRPFQRTVHDSIRRMNPFVFTGQKVDPLMLCGIGAPKPGFFYYNIDMSAATDGSSQNIGMEVVEYLTQEFPPAARESVRRAFSCHEIEYPWVVYGSGGEDASVAYKRLVANLGDQIEVSDLEFSPTLQEIEKGVRETKQLKVRVKSATQKTGQLMGSPVSFNILCLMNAIVYLRIRRAIAGCASVRSDISVRKFAELVNKESTSKLLSQVRINGDDCVFQAPDWCWDLIVSEYKKFGFNMSVGKAYRHPNYVQINSKSYVWRDGEPTPVFCPYMNVGLYFGRHKVQSKEGNSNAADCLDEVIKGTPHKHRRRVVACYIKQHEATIRNDTRFFDENGVARSRNLWLPRSLGGMGIEPPLDFTFDIDIYQQRLARQLMIDSQMWDTQRPFRGYEPSGRSTLENVFAKRRTDPDVDLHPSKPYRLKRDTKPLRKSVLRKLAGFHPVFVKEVETGPPIGSDAVPDDVAEAFASALGIDIDYEMSVMYLEVKHTLQHRD